MKLITSAARILITAILTGVVFFLLYAVFGLYIQQAFDAGRQYQKQQSIKTGVPLLSSATEIDHQDSTYRYRDSA